MRLGFTNVLQEPANLQGAEVGGKRQAGLGAKAVGTTLLGEFGDHAFHAGVLPDDGVADGESSIFVPENRGFALIGDADGGQILGLQDILLHGLADDVLGATPDFFGVMFHPTGRRIDLFVLLLCLRDDAAGAVKDDEASAGGALIESS